MNTMHGDVTYLGVNLIKLYETTSTRLVVGGIVGDILSGGVWTAYDPRRSGGGRNSFLGNYKITRILI